jgi:tRNA(fMet)-specific endonuclease VapC
MSETMRPSPDERVTERIRAAAGSLATAAPAWHELDFGRRALPQGRRRTHLDRGFEALAAVLRVLPYDAAAASWHAEQRVRLMGRGRTPPFVDAQIAAVAATNRLVLVTRNARDFRGFDGLVVESWFD